MKTKDLMPLIEALQKLEKKKVPIKIEMEGTRTGVTINPVASNNKDYDILMDLGGCNIVIKIEIPNKTITAKFSELYPDEKK